MAKRYLGSCHCGAVAFEASVDLSRGTTKCNCSICTKLRNWTVQVEPSAFYLAGGASDLSVYRGNNPVAHHFFCSHCGVHPFARVDMPNMSGMTYYNINVACLDGVDVDVLVTAPMSFRDGRNDNWGSEPSETRHL